MQSDDGTSLVVLANKIKILKDKLFTYGWSHKETHDFILYDFMKLPRANWDKMETTLTYYQIKDKYKVPPDATELILCMTEIIPNIHSKDVLQYLHTMFEISAIQYGIDVFDSSSDSSQNPRIVRSKTKGDKNSRKRNRSITGRVKTNKKVHIQSQIFEKRQKDSEVDSESERGYKQKSKEVRLVRKRKKQNWQDFDDLQKNVKKDDL